MVVTLELRGATRSLGGELDTSSEACTSKRGGSNEAADCCQRSKELEQGALCIDDRIPAICLYCEQTALALGHFHRNSATSFNNPKP